MTALPSTIWVPTLSSDSCRGLVLLPAYLPYMTPISLKWSGWGGKVPPMLEGYCTCSLSPITGGAEAQRQEALGWISLRAAFC